MSVGAVRLATPSVTDPRCCRPATGSAVGRRPAALSAGLGWRSRVDSRLGGAHAISSPAPGWFAPGWRARVGSPARTRVVGPAAVGPRRYGRTDGVMDGVVRDILGRQLEAWLTRVVVRGRPSVVALAFGQGALLAAVDSAEVVLGVLAQHADRLRGRQLTVLVLADGNEELPARLGALEATLPAGVAVHLVPGGPARLPVAVKAAGAAGTPLLSYLDGTGATDPAVLAAGAAGRPGELLLVTDTNFPGVTDTDLPSVTDTDRPGAASAPVVPASAMPASTGPVPAPPASAVPASAVPASAAPGSAPPVPGPPTSDVPASTAPGSALPAPGPPRSDVPASTAPGSALPAPGPPARVSGSVQASLVRAGFPLATQVDLVPIDGSSARRLVLGTGHDRSLEAFKDILWTVDEDAGIRYRDPADPAQHLLHIAADPEPGPLCRELLAELARTGPRTVTELRRHALTATPYRSIDVRRALTEMLTSGAATRDPEHGRLGGNVVITVARRP
ncbi:hypothetical protein [Salinispora arenicola]|uniref:hypothetical protein n=1 Tax=Salinispora arenicola TaxID=168697 RepID=UPI000373E765|nr:hypothetical protein [Salinispora arenicola]